MKSHIPSAHRFLLEALEDRLLLSNTLLPVTDHDGLIFDAARNRLYITTDTNIVRRYDLATAQFLTPWTLGTNVLDGDITPDDSALYLTEQSGNVIHKLNLNTDAVTDLTYTLQSGDLGSNWLAITSDNKAVFSNYGTSGHAYTIDLSNDTIASLSSPFWDEIGYLFRSADRSTAAVTGVYSDGPLAVYSAATGSFSPAFNTGFAHSRINEAVSRDGALIATDVPLTGHQSIVVRNRLNQTVANIAGQGAAFSPINDQLLVASGSSITIYDTTTWQPLATLDLGETYATSADLGLMRFSDDGSKLFVNTTDGIRIVDVPIHIWPVSISLDASPASPTALQPATFSVAVAGSTADSTGFTPTGTITLRRNGATLATAALVNGQATFTLGLVAGNAALTAQYDGDSDFASTTSAPLNLIIPKTTPTVSFLINGQTTQSLALDATITVTANVGTGATGILKLIDTATNKTVLALFLQNGAISAAAFLPLAAGTYSLRADYPGDANFTAASAAPFTLTIDRSTPSITVDNTSGLLIAYVYGISAFPPTGTVSFYQGATLVGTATLNNGSASLTGKDPTVSYTATYNGDTDYNPASASTIPAPPPPPAAPATTTAITVSATNLRPNQPLTITATISAGSSGAAIAGTVNFLSDGVSLGTQTVVNNKATITLASLPLGIHTLQANFVPSSNVQSSYAALADFSVAYPTVIDLLALWPVNSGVNASTIVQQIKDSVAAANTAFANSEIPITIRLVGISVLPPAPVYSGYIHFTKDLGRDLTFLNNPADGVWDNVPFLKNAFGADAVVLFDTNGEINNAGDLETVGISNELNPFNPLRAQTAYAVVDPTVPTSYYVLAHELGHLLGATHAVGDPTPYGATTYAHGYRFTGNDGVLYHDIMAYDPGTTIPYFSNPNLTYAGVPIGNATANASLTIRLFASIVANYHAAPKPFGAVEAITPNQISGWVYDPKSLDAPVKVFIVIDGVIRATITADATRNDLYPRLGSVNHGFSYTPAGLTPGNHAVYVIVQDTLTNVPTVLAGRTITVANSRPVGGIDMATANTLTGWTLDLNAPTTALKITLKIDGVIRYISTAAQTRTGLIPLFGSPNHGFTITLPTLTPGPHTLLLYATDTTTNQPLLLAARTLTV